MATIDTTLDFFKIPGIDTFTHTFGTKKPSGKGLTTEEVANNIAASFMRQRPFVVTETSNTQRIDANSIFLITANEPASPIVLTLGEAAFIGCEVSVINKSEVQHSLNATYSGSTLGTVTLTAKSKMSLIWAGDGWIILDSQKINNNEFASALSPKDLPAVEAMNFGENSGYIKWTNGLLIQWGTGNTFPIAFKNTDYFIVPTEVLGEHPLPVIHRTFIMSKTTASIQFWEDEVIFTWHDGHVYTANRRASSPKWFAIGY